MLLLAAVVGAVVLGKRKETCRCSLSRSFFSAVLFTIGVVGVLTRRNAIIIFMCVELMLNAVNLTFVAFAQVYGVAGQVFVFFVMTVAAAEAAVGLAIIIALFRHRQTVESVRTSISSRADAPSSMQRRRGRASAERHGRPVAVWLLPLLPLARLRHQRRCCRSSRAYHPGPADPSAAHGDDDAHARRTRHDARRGGAHGDDHHAGRAASSTPGIASSSGRACCCSSFVLARRDLHRDARRGGEMHAPFIQRYFSWMPVGDLQIDAAFQLDQLSMVMMLVITGVGTLIHIFSVGYMQDDPGYPRYFAYLNLFVFFMLVLVLGASYPVMFVGWEGVGLCSYLLIGFWFSEKANADAGKKAFIVNRIGDFGFLIAMFMLFANLGALDFVGRERARRAAARRSAARWSRRSASSCSSAAPARARRSRSTSGCPTPWPARRRSRR